MKHLFHFVLALFTKNGYRLKWGVLRGNNVGSPQMRPRWFALGIRNDSNGDRLRALVGKPSYDLEVPWNPTAQVAIEDRLTDEYTVDMANSSKPNLGYRGPS